jgi:hypothetical protein
MALKIVNSYCDRFGLWDAARKYIKDREALSRAIPKMASDAMAGNGIDTNIKVPAWQDVVSIYESLGEKLFNSH